MMNRTASQIRKLLEKGVQMPLPETVLVGDAVDTDRISGNGVTIYPGSRIFGKDTFIHHHSEIGYEAPVTIENCQIGSRVKLKGGFFKESVFLDDVNMGSGSHVREGTICEEGSSCAHTVGLKQTILFPFVTLGSLINFCDCLMAGGTSRKNHSEVGSSYIHFNYTPNQDKATASLLGDVPKGVMLKEHPVFLGGQGGLVGPCNLQFGTVVAAGTIMRKDESRPNRLIIGSALKEVNLPLARKISQNTKRIVENNVNYIANLIALKTHYRNIRMQFIGDAFPYPLVAGLMDNIDRGINERIKRLEGFLENVGDTSNDFVRKWPQIEENLRRYQHDISAIPSGELFVKRVKEIVADTQNNYIETITSLSKDDSTMGTKWLQEIVETINTTILAVNEKQ